MTDDLIRIADLSLRFGRTLRATFHPDGVRSESDTDHTHMLGMVCLEILAKNGAEAYRLGIGEDVLILALVHDLLEAYTGDESTLGLASLPPEAREMRKSAKAERERMALVQMRKDHADSPWLLWAIEEYERQDTVDANFVRWVDKILPKITHTLNGGAAVRAAGMTPEQLEADHEAQGRQLAEQYPHLVYLLGPIFDEVCTASVQAYRAALLAVPKE